MKRSTENDLNHKSSIKHFLIVCGAHYVCNKNVELQGKP